jgi:hypothetical protein
MSQWLDLHTQLANTLGDPRTNAGAFISSTTDGIRYTAEQRAFVLSQAIRWVVTNIISDSQYTSLLVLDEIPTFTTVDYLHSVGAPFKDRLLLANPILKLLSVETMTSTAAEEGAEATVLPRILVPIINKKYKKLLRTKNSHWANTSFAYLSSQENGCGTIEIIGKRTGEFAVTYLKDFTNFTGQSIDTDDIYIPDSLIQYSISYAVHLVKLNEQRWKEALELKNDSITEAITFKNLEEGNVNNKTR